MDNQKNKVLNVVNNRKTERLEFLRLGFNLTSHNDF